MARLQPLRGSLRIGVMHKPSCLLLLAFLASASLAIAAEEAAKPAEPRPQTLAELEAEMRKVLADTKTNAVGVALVSRDEVLWAAGLGQADVASELEADADTLFRIGSISKMFVSLAALKLEHEGRLSLEDRLAERLPDLEFENPWEASDPVRLVHLLEHTAGFDDIRLSEYALNDPTISLAAALAFQPASRVSRWRPGTRDSYCNSGPPIVARVIETIVDQPFEDYVRSTFFEPLGMTTATYYEPPAGTAITTLYKDDGKTPEPYWHIAFRPSGSINASPTEMARLLRFFLGRGTFEGRTLLPPSALERMERPATRWSAQAGVALGYGLSNYTDEFEGRVFHGHNGGVNGGLAALGYLPTEGLGYAFMINSGSGEAYRRLSQLIKGYLVRELPPAPEPPPAVAVPAEVRKRFSGYYRPASPRQQVTHFLERIVDVHRVTVGAEGLELKPWLDKGRKLVATGPRSFREEKGSASSAVLVDDARDGRFLQTDRGTLRKASVWVVWLERLLAPLCLALTLSVFPVAPVWVAVRWVRRQPGKAWSLAALTLFGAVLALGAAFFALALAGPDMIARLGRLTPYSLTFFLGLLAFGLLAVAGAALTWRAPVAQVKPLSRAYWRAAGVGALSVALYLTYWGLIGFRPWV